MTLLTKHLEAGWHEVESGEFGRWVAERFYSRPGASSSVVRVEAESSKKLQDAVSLRQSQLDGTEEPVKDTITNDGTLVTGPQHEALRTDGIRDVLSAEQVAEPVPNADEVKQVEGDPSEGVVDAPQAPADAADLSAPADADASDEAESQSTPSSDEATPAAVAAAEEHGVDLSEVEGSGQDGRVLKSDVEAAASEQE